jgi:uncharacterized membrane protein
MNKTFSFAIVHFTVAFTVAWVMTGSWLVGGALALVEPAINTIAFFFHEKFWQHLQSRRKPERPMLA